MDIAADAIGSPSSEPAAEADAPVGARAAVKDAVGKAMQPAAPADDEIEFEFEDGKKEKLKRSVLRDRFFRSKEIEAQSTRRLAEIQRAYEERVKPIEEYARQLKQNPMALFEIAKSMGLDPDDVARQYAQEYVKRADMTPEQRRIWELEQRLQGQEQTERQRQESAQKEQYEREQVALKQQVEQEIVQAAQKHGIPKHPMALALLNSFAAAQLRAGFEKPDFGMAAEQVHEYAKGYVADWVKGLDYQGLVKNMPDLVKIIRAGDMKAASGGQVPSRPRAARQDKPMETINPEDWRRQYVANLK